MTPGAPVRRRPRACTWAALLAVALLLAGCGVWRPDAGAPDYSVVSTTAESPLRRAERATVRVRNSGCGALSVGSGVVIDEHRLLTNAHVIAGADTLEINLWDGRTLDAAVEGAAVDADLALVEVADDLTAEDGATVATFATQDPEEGTAVRVMGYPGGRSFAELDGVLVDYREVNGERSQVLSTKVEPGNSGGPVVADDGSVVGLVRAQLVETKEGVAVPASTLTASLDAMSGTIGDIPDCDDFAVESGAAARVAG